MIVFQRPTLQQHIISPKEQRKPRNRLFYSPQEGCITCACRYESGNPVADVDIDAMCQIKPETVIACASCGFCEDYVQNAGCSGNGKCKDNVCICDSGFSGSICDMEFDCASGVLGLDRACCDSGVVDTSGTCCIGTSDNTPVQDADGDCCASGLLDACGVCDGSALYVDVLGVCCPVSGSVSRFCWCNS